MDSSSTASRGSPRASSPLSRSRATRLLVARVEGNLLAFRDACAGCGASLGDGELDEGTLRCPELRAPLLPAAGGPLARRRPAAARAGAAARRLRPPEGGARPVSETLDARVAARRQAELIASLRRLTRPSAGQSRPAPPAAGAVEVCDLCGKELDPDHRHLLHLTERQHPLRLRELRRAARRRPRAAADRHADRLARRLRPARRALGRRSRSRSGSPSSSTRARSGGIVALYPSPAGATESELDLDAWSRAAERRTRCSMSLEPDAEALIVNRMPSRRSTRSPRSTSATGWSG